MNRFDELFIESAMSVFAAAHARTLASGNVVVLSRDGDLLRLHPDGSEELIKLLEKPTTVRPGLTVSIQHPPLR